MSGVVSHRSDSAPRSPGAQLVARIDPESVSLRTAPFTVTFLILAIGVVLYAGTERYALLAVTTVVVIGLQLVAAIGPWDRWPRTWQYQLPLVQMACLVGLDAAVEISQGYYNVVLFLPVVSLALQPSTTGILLGTAGTAAVSLGVSIAEPGPLADVELTVIRTLVVTTCAFLVGVGVYAVTQRLRDRTAAVEALQHEQQAALLVVARQRDRLTDQAAALEGSQALLRSIVDAATELLVLATDDGGRILLSSPGAERVLGRTVASLTETDVVDLFEPTELDQRARTGRAAAGPGDDEPAARLLAAVGSASGGHPEHREATFLRADGSSVPVDLLVTRRRRLDEPEAEGYLFVVTDLTEVRESERLQDEFIGLVSHELRTPLASILGYTELLQSDEGSLPTEERSYVAVVDRNARRLLRLVEDLLLSVQVAAGTFSLAAEDVDVSRLVGESVANLEPSAAAAGVTVSFHPEGQPRFVTDPQRLAQVVENLVANAIKFTPRGGTVRVELTGSEPAGGVRSGAESAGTRRLTLTVTDDGPGMTAEEVARVTERFFRTEAARRQRVHGLGLGLSIVDAIVHAHGGRLTIGSSPGAGTRITVELPGLRSRPQPAAVH
jgi:signal transduction histidine kinase